MSDSRQTRFEVSVRSLIVEVEALVVDLWVLVDAVHPVGVEVRCAAFDPVDLVALLDDVVLAEVGPGLDLDQFQWDLPRFSSQWTQPTGR